MDNSNPVSKPGTKKKPHPYPHENKWTTSNPKWASSKTTPINLTPKPNNSCKFQERKAQKSLSLE